MNPDDYIWIERLTSLHKSQMRRAAVAEGLQLVHFEVLQYLNLCNRFSDTPQALSKYLGQTKGSISQTLKFLEQRGFLDRRTDEQDRRVTHLGLTKAARACLARMARAVVPVEDLGVELRETLQAVLKAWQRSVGQAGFGQCQSCRYNETRGQGKFYCALVEVPLTSADVRKLCVEHTFAS